jgi:hypothetical protein
MQRFLFPRWANKVLPITFFLVLGPLGTAAMAGVWYYGTNKHIEVGYQPTQPVPYSHKLHAGDMGIDCRYCHSNVERGAMALVPATETCMNCHSKVRTDSTRLLPVRESFANDKPIPWIRIHNLPDYVYFDHSAHLSVGVGCVTCHGRIDHMVTVKQEKPLSMGWCLACHRDPEPHLRDPAQITNMSIPDLNPENPGTRFIGRKVNPPLHCSGCHR